ncbi:WD repeat-containing protein [Drosera capensis]
MGGLEDSGPPLKRVKESSGEAKISFRNSICFESPASSLGVPMPRSLHSQGDGAMTGTTGVMRKQEFVKIITRALYSLGYNRTGALLEEESGVPLHTPMVSRFMKEVQEGRWDESVVTLHEIGVSKDDVKSASFVILEQKFLELLQKGRASDALNTLRNEITPLGINVNEVHKLAARVVFHSSSAPSTNGAVPVSSRADVLEKLEKVLPPAVIVPEKRLEHLVKLALDVQRDSCVFHNTFDSEFSLYADHQCGRNKIPSQTHQILQAHSDEVWFLEFSHNGRYLASTSKDHSAIIWEVKEDGEVFVKHKLVGHQKPVSIVSWSPDDSQFLTCGQEEVIRCWSLHSGECLQVYEKPGLGLISCGWLPDGRGVLSGVTDKSIILWDVDGRELECWKGQRTIKISDMAVTSDGKRIISICRDNAILLLDRQAKMERLLEEDQVITSFSLSRDNRFLLVNLINQEIHLWSIEGDLKVVSKYKGHKRSRFIIRSCFGGSDQAFIASGSEDSQVYIWHRSTGEHLVALPGHSGAVNCVSWNPANPHMLASASDDRSVRIWGIGSVGFKSSIANTSSNGCSNGNSNGFIRRSFGRR